MGKGSLSINQIVVFTPSSINNYLTLYVESLFVSSIDISSRPCPHFPNMCFLLILNLFFYFKRGKQSKNYWPDDNGPFL